MKKVLCILLVIFLCSCLCACTFTNEDGSSTIAGIAIERGIYVLASFLESALFVAGTWLIGILGKQAKLKNITKATETLLTLTRQTVGELQQTLVDDWKAFSKDGKLTPEQIEDLRCNLLDLVKMKLDDATKDLIIAAGADLDALIIGEAESWINYLKPAPNYEPVEEFEIEPEPEQEETE